MSTQEIRVPDLGGAESVEVIELCVTPGAELKAEDPVVVVESDKATVELPAPTAGRVVALSVKVGDRVRTGDVVGVMDVADTTARNAPAEAALEPPRETTSAPETEPAPAPPPTPGPGVAAPVTASVETTGGEPTPAVVHAGPAVRKLAREFGVELGQVSGTGPHQRILKEDVQAYVKRQMQQAQGQGVTGGALPGVRLPDFAQFGPIERRPLSRLQWLTAENMQRSWLNVPHVTQFDEADITELEAFRVRQKPVGQARGIGLTVLPFLLKACARVLQELPQFNVSLDLERRERVQKQYVHIGIAVDTPAGLVVPVIRDVDQKGIWVLAEEAQALAAKARDKKLTPAEMQGACFTITSLGGIGGTAFTPIVNTPEVAILGVSRAAMKPVWEDGQFVPRLMLPLSLSYDHRAVNGADGARFTVRLAQLLGDVRELLM